MKSSAGKNPTVLGGGSLGQTPSTQQGPLASGKHRPTKRQRPVSTSGIDKPVTTLPIGQDGVTVTRRHFIYGAAAVGAVAAIGAGGSAIAKAIDGHRDDGADVLEVASSSVISSDDLIETDASTYLSMIADFELPYGTLIWSSDNDLAACLLPTDGASPLTQIGILYLKSGNVDTVLNGAVELASGYEIMDVRATSGGAIWVESNVLQNTWRVYTATLSNGNLGEPILVDSGDSEWEMPSIAATGQKGYWQVMPNLKGNSLTENSTCKSTPLGKSQVDVVFTSEGRFATAPYALSDSIVITPRADTSATHYRLTRIDCETGEALDAITLPQSMKPLEAGFGKTGFMFSFDGIYDYGDGISNLGTYAPLQLPKAGSAVPNSLSEDEPKNQKEAEKKEKIKGTTAATETLASLCNKAYGDTEWLRYARTPSAAPAWCKDLLIVKGKQSVCGIDVKERAYFALDVLSGSDDYGDYLATTGEADIIVTFSNIKDNPIEGGPTNCTYARAWQAL